MKVRHRRDRSIFKVHSHSGVILLCLCLLTACAAKPVYVTSVPIGQTDYSGHWELDPQMSENPEDKIRWLYTAARSELLRRQARSRGEGPMLRNTAKLPTGTLEAVVGLGRLAEIIAQATALVITQKNQHIVIERNDDFDLICDLAEKTEGVTGVGQQRCAWIGNQLAFEIRLPEGLRVFHLLTLSPDASRLNLATTVRSSRAAQAFTLNRVYMPFEPIEDEYDCENTLVNKTTCTLGGSVPR